MAVKRPIAQLAVGDLVEWQGWERVEEIETRPDGSVHFITHSGNGCIVKGAESIDMIKRVSAIRVDVYEDGQVVTVGGSSDWEGRQ